VVTSGAQGIGRAIVESILAGGGSAEVCDLEAPASQDADFQRIDVGDFDDVSRAAGSP
jgi:hypothetical protein